MSDAQTRERDMAVSTKQAPQGFWDPQTRIETVQSERPLQPVPRRSPQSQDAASMPPPHPPGQGEGLFFGVRRQYAEVFNTVTTAARSTKQGSDAVLEDGARQGRDLGAAVLPGVPVGASRAASASLYPRLQTDVGQQ